MRPSITYALIIGALALSATALGCRDSGPSAPRQALDNHASSDGGGARNGDESDDSTSAPGPPNTHTPATPAPRPDTAVRNPPPLPASFTLRGVALGAVTRSDTMQTVRLPGVTASLYRVKAADGTAVQPEVLVGTATADVNGEFTFRDLPSAYYRLDVKAPADGPYVDASRTIAPPWSTEIAVHVVLLRKS